MCWSDIYDSTYLEYHNAYKGVKSQTDQIKEVGKGWQKYFSECLKYRLPIFVWVDMVALEVSVLVECKVAGAVGSVLSDIALVLLLTGVLDLDDESDAIKPDLK